MRAGIFDACVLYPAALRDLLLRMIQADLVQGYWTARILDECFRSVIRDRPDLDPVQLQRTREAMEAYFPDRMVEGHEHLIEGLDLPDANDRHVLAAAISVRVPVIVTFNLRDFPSSRLTHHGVVAVHPDTFVLAAIDRAPEEVVEVLHRQVASLRRPPTTLSDLMDRLASQGLSGSVEALRPRVG